MEKIQEQIPGVTVSVALDGKPVGLTAEGMMPTANPGDGSKFTLGLTVSRYVDVLVARIGQPHSKEKTVQAWTPRKGDETTVSYELAVEVKNSAKYECLVTHHPVNYLAVVVLDHKGNFDFWEVAVVSQRGTFFVTTQKKYSARLYGFKGTAVVPQFANWPELREVLAERHGVKKYDLAPMSEFKLTLNSKPKTLGVGQAEVVWYDMALGLGCIRLNDGRTARVFVNQVAARPRLSYLTAGEIVKYKKLVDLPPGGGGFTLDAHGVRPVSK